MKKFNYSKALIISISALLLIMGSIFVVMADETTTVLNKNNVAVGHSEGYAVEAVGQMRTTVDEEGYYSAPNAKTTTNDKQDDDVFAGWYKDSACKSPLKADELAALINNEDKKDEIIYAKFVSQEILNVKAQLQNTVDSTSSNAILRVITTVDGADYQEVGFNIEFDENTYSKSSDTVSKKLSVIGNTGEESKISPTEFHDGSLYFMAVNLTKIQAASFEKEAKAVPYWVTLDGTKVENSNVKTKSVFQGMPTVCETRVTDASGENTRYYSTLEKAFYVLNSTNHYLAEGDTVTVIQDDVEIEKRLNVYTNITLTNEANRDVVITRSYNNSHFMYYNSSTLTVEGTVLEGDDKGSLTFDGKEESSTYGCIESRTAESNLTLKNVSIKNILVNRQGSAVYAHGTATITGCTFENNIVNECSDSYSGAIYFNGSGKTLSVDECEFISNNTTSGNGGAIYVRLGDTVTISNTDFNSNSALSGGALYVWRAVANVSGCTFTSNASTEANGGAIYHGEDTTYDTKTLTLTNCTFDSNHTASTGNGGAVYMNYGPATVSGSTFISNGSDGADLGGAIYVNDGTTTISDSEFSSNQATSKGGAIYFGEDTENIKELTLTGCTFDSNNTVSAGHGGAVYVNSGTAGICGSTFESNGTTGADMGGAIYINSGTTTIAGSGFSLNTATSRGGAVYDNEGTVTIKETCTFSENSAVNGGALYEHGGATDISDSSFTSNDSDGTATADGGGAIYYRGREKAILTLTRCAFNSNNAANRAGAVYVYRGGAEITGSTFSSNETSDGGAIYVRDGNTDISDTDFESNTATANGGAVYINMNTATVDVTDGCTFSENSATKSGGAVYDNLGTLTVENSCSFSGNSAANGGALYVYQGTTGISGSTFTSNTSTGANGGAIFYGESASDGKELTVTNCTFTSNDTASAGHGGAVYVNSGTAGVNGSTFTSNGTTGVDMGGAIYVNQGETTISGSDFSLNKAASNGGAVYDNEGTVTIKETCTFSENSAAEGGALYEYGGATEISDSSFTSNVSNSTTKNAGGGAIYHRGKSASTKLKLTRCTFTSNEATGNTGARAGAVYIYRGGATITGSTFTSNGWNATTEEATTVKGGAIYVRTGAVDFSDTNFESNKATESGGAVYAQNYNNTTSNVSNSTFTSNGLETTPYGGAIYTEGGATTVSNTEFTSNQVATDGGAIYNLKGALTVNNGCTFTSNTANNSNGGAIYVSDSTATLDVSASTFTSNRAYITTDVTTAGGGAIYVDAAQGEISNSVFDQNIGRRGGAIHVNAGSVTIEDGCMFSGNTARRGGAMYFYSTGTGSVRDCIFIGNGTTTTGSEVITAYGGAFQCYKTMTIDGCVFDKNVATNASAGYSQTDTFNITNTTLIDQAEADFNDSKTTRITLLTQENTLSETTSFVDNIHDADDGHQLSLLTNIDEAGFEAYCARIESMGFVLKSENTMGEETQTVARTYYSTERGYMLHTYWVEYSQEVRTQVASIDEAMLAPLVTAQSMETTEAVCAPLFHQLEALNYDDTAGIQSLEGGMGYIIRLKDGRFIIIDGGHRTETDSENPTETTNVNSDTLEILAFLAKNAPDPSKVVIASWIFTHAHSDHSGAFVNFTKYLDLHIGKVNYDYGTSLEQVTLQSVMLNACDTEEQVAYCDGHGKTEILTEIIPNYWEAKWGSNPVVYKPLTGQEYRFADTSIEILHTMSDFLPQTIGPEPDGKGGDYNVQTVVSMVDIDCNSDKSDKFFIMGDTTKVACDEMSRRYGTYLESDYVQVAHHGYNEFTNYVGTELEHKNSRRHGATQEIYELILKDDGSTIVMWPTSDKRFADKTQTDTTSMTYIAINDWLYRTGQSDPSKHWIAESVSDENRTIEFE